MQIRFTFFSLYFFSNGEEELGDGVCSPTWNKYSKGLTVHLLSGALGGEGDAEAFQCQNDIKNEISFQGLS